MRAPRVAVFLPLLACVVRGATKRSAAQPAKTLKTNQKPVCMAHPGFFSARAMVAHPLAASAGVLGACNLAGFGISVATGSHVHLDLLGTGAFAVAAAATTGDKAARRLVSAGMVGAWATRLAGFLFYRALQTGRDARLEGTLSTTSGAAKFWTISFLWGWLAMLPHTLGAASRRAPLLNLGHSPGAIVACAAYGVGLFVEVAADLGKSRFKADPANRGKFCDVGLWRVSQHPNYFGNLLLWTGIWALNAPALGPAALAFSTLSPLFLATLLHGQSSGKITNAVKLADAKYAGDPRYEAYKRDTPLIVPRPLSLAGAIKDVLFFGPVGAGPQRSDDNNKPKST